MNHNKLDENNNIINKNIYEYSNSLERYINSFNENIDENAFLVFTGKVHESSWYKRIFHKILKWITKSNLTHVSILLKKDNELLCLESTSPKTQINDGKWIWSGDHEGFIIKLNNVSQKEHVEIIKKLSKKYLGTKYGILQLFGSLISRLFGFKKNYLSSGDAEQVCSELGYIYLDQIKYYQKYLKGLNLDIVAPNELYDRIKDDNNVEFYNKIILREK